MLKKRILPSAVTAILFAAAIAGAHFLLANLGNLVIAAASYAGDAAEALQGVGAQINVSPKAVHILIPAAIGVFWTALRFACPPKGWGSRTLFVLGGILLWIAAFAAALLLARLGGIRILDIVRSMAELIGGGILEHL